MEERIGEGAAGYPTAPPARASWFDTEYCIFVGTFELVRRLVFPYWHGNVVFLVRVLVTSNRPSL